MNIKIKCKECGNQYDISENDFMVNAHCYKFCEFCGGEMKVKNIEEIVEHDTKIRVKEYVDKWFKEIGADEAIDLIKRTDNPNIKKLYIEELKKRGFNIKEE